MGKLIYSAIASLDGYVEDEAGGFDWAAPDEDVHAFVNRLERPVGTYLYGRGMYETMAAWETMPLEASSEVTRDFAEIWRGAQKIVFSRTLDDVDTRRTRLERRFDSGAIQELKQTTPHDLSVGGPTLAAEAFKAGLVDELHLFLHPITVGAGKAALPHHLRLRLELLAEDRFESGVVHLHYRVVAPGGPGAGAAGRGAEVAGA